MPLFCIMYKPMMHRETWGRWPSFTCVPSGKHIFSPLVVCVNHKRYDDKISEPNTRMLADTLPRLFIILLSEHFSPAQFPEGNTVQPVRSLLGIVRAPVGRLQESAHHTLSCPLYPQRTSRRHGRLSGKMLQYVMLLKRFYWKHSERDAFVVAT